MFEANATDLRKYPVGLILGRLTISDVKTPGGIPVALTREMEIPEVNT
jgi:hypothetical protein